MQRKSLEFKSKDKLDMEIEKTEDGKILVRIEKSLYSTKALFSAAYKFTGSCFVDIYSIDEQYYGVSFSAKSFEVDIVNQANHFRNELIDQELRISLDESNRSIKELIMRQAFFPFKENGRS